MLLRTIPTTWTAAKALSPNMTLKFNSPIGSTGLPMNSVIDYLEHWTAVQPDRCFSFRRCRWQGKGSLHVPGFSRAQLPPRGVSSRGGGAETRRSGATRVPAWPRGRGGLLRLRTHRRDPGPRLPTDVRTVRGGSKLAFVARDCEAPVALTITGFYSISSLWHAPRAAEAQVGHDRRRAGRGERTAPRRLGLHSVPAIHVRIDKRSEGRYRISRERDTQCPGPPLTTRR